MRTFAPVDLKLIVLFLLKELERYNDGVKIGYQWQNTVYSIFISVFNKNLPSKSLCTERLKS